MTKAKKIILLVAFAASAALVSACGDKLCYCYTITPQQVYEEAVYTNYDTPCNALNNSTRSCVEENERMNPGDIAHK